MPGHTHGKVRVLREAGFENLDVICVSEHANIDEMKEKLKSYPGCLFIVGGAMNSSHPDLMAELNSFIASEVPSIIVHNTTVGDFPADCPKPPTEDIVNQSALTIANRYLQEC